MATKAELEAELAAARAALEAARAADVVTWSARIPRELRDQVRAVQGATTVQDITVEALHMWLEARRA